MLIEKYGTQRECNFKKIMLKYLNIDHVQYLKQFSNQNKIIHCIIVAHNTRHILPKNLYIIFSH